MLTIDFVKIPNQTDNATGIHKWVNVPVEMEVDDLPKIIYCPTCGTPVGVEGENEQKTS